MTLLDYWAVFTMVGSVVLLVRRIVFNRPPVVVFEALCLGAWLGALVFLAVGVVE